ncbi:hypothetical protein [Dyella sp. Tek66A03]|uniref:hypothetical protein n=1 Tax=Dyella sp. Tek66A03 TaxID=3458298 RepID=UPI00403E5B03
MTLPPVSGYYDINPDPSWNRSASSHFSVHMRGADAAVIGSSMASQNSAVQLAMGPAILSMSDEQALQLANALTRAVEKRRAVFDTPKPAGLSRIM